jgi:hypothetical protein
MLQKNMGGGWLAACVGGGGVAGNLRPALNFKENVMFAGMRVMGVFDGDCSLGGGD